MFCIISINRPKVYADMYVECLNIAFCLTKKKWHGNKNDMQLRHFISKRFLFDNVNI